MSRRLYRRERLDAIVRRLEETGYISVTELSEIFDVSAVTVRGDLALLESAGYLVRTHGGALPIDLSDSALSFSVRQRAQAELKARIGAAAAELVTDGEAIVLDASTTSWHVARCLLSRHDLTVFTTGLYVALELLRAPGISVIIPGGPVWREAASVIDSPQGDVERLLARGNLRVGFFGGRGLTLQEGLTDANPTEVELKRRLMAAVREVNVVLDSTKLGKVAFAPFAPIDSIHRLITDRGAPNDLVDALRDRGIEVILA
ncbi:MAG TPA: DeoR/GlpR transcriptional regulator [Chloroflexi bacterium]|jgi:DeoR/GlpR family transcriptional regulator of sugar metabolism|nr:DeoR/GlpR transcriptional regulator [Chloroflexota bacterium]